MRRTAFACTAVVLSLAAAITVAASRQEVPGGTVEYGRGTLTVHLTQPTDLLTVLEAICRATDSRCDVAASAAEVELPPLALSGTWRAVITQLFEGAGHNYAALEPRGGQGGRLWVEARPPGGGSDQLPAGTYTLAGRNPASSSLQERTAARTSLEEREPGQPRAGDNPQGTASEADASTPGTDFGGRAGDAEQQRMTEESLRMLYEGWKAPRAPQPTSGMIELPFVGPDGRPVTIPAANRPITEYPWPGPDGKPIPVTPMPGTRLEWPFPVTPSNPPNPPQ